MRVFETSGKASTIGDLFRIFAATTRDQASFNWVTIPETLDLGSSDELFDPATMRAL
jgi:hypothetical protein